MQKIFINLTCINWTPQCLFWFGFDRFHYIISIYSDSLKYESNKT